MDNNTFSAKQAIETIEAGINHAATVRTGAARYYIIWGSILCAHFALQALIRHNPSWHVSLLNNCSLLLFPLGGLLSAWQKKTDKQHETAIPQFENIYFAVFVGFALAYAVLFVSSLRTNPMLAVVYFPLLIGLAVFITGYLTKHKASIVGGVLSILLCGISVGATAETSYWLASLAALVACFIPGLRMKGRHV